MAQPTITVVKNDGSGTVVTASYPGRALASSQVKQRKASYVNASGTSVEATVDLTGFTPALGQE